MALPTESDTHLSMRLSCRWLRVNRLLFTMCRSCPPGRRVRRSYRRRSHPGRRGQGNADSPGLTMPMTAAFLPLDVRPAKPRRWHSFLFQQMHQTFILRRISTGASEIAHAFTEQQTVPAVKWQGFFSRIIQQACIIFPGGDETYRPGYPDGWGVWSHSREASAKVVPGRSVSWAFGSRRYSGASS